MTNTRSALITGASGGIGEGIARHLARDGWELTLAARRRDRLQRLREDLASDGAAGVEIVVADMADPEQVDSTVRAHAAAYGAMNALVVAAGVGSAAPLADYPISRFDKQLAVGLRAPFQLVSSCMDLLRIGAGNDTAHGARVIALASVAGVYPQKHLAAYSSSKAALISLMQSINTEEGSAGILATAISPGYVDTDMSEWISDRIPRSTMITVNDVVKVVNLILTVSANTALPHIVMSRAGHPFSA